VSLAAGELVRDSQPISDANSSCQELNPFAGIVARLGDRRSNRSKGSAWTEGFWDWIQIHLECRPLPWWKSLNSQVDCALDVITSPGYRHEKDDNDSSSRDDRW